MSSYIDYSIQTRNDFKNWIFRQLGYPLITPEIRSETLDDFINDALEEFTEYAVNEQSVFAFNLKDYIPNKGYYMPPDVCSVINLYDYGVHNSSSQAINPFSFGFMMVNGGFVPSPFNGRSGRSGWFDYHQAMAWLDLTYLMTGKGFEWQYNPRTKLLRLDPDPISYFHLDPERDCDVGNWIVAEVYRMRPEEEQYGEVWVKRMALAKAKSYIAMIRKTYGDIGLPGGAKITESTMGDGKEEEKELREELLKRYPTLAIYHG